MAAEASSSSGSTPSGFTQSEINQSLKPTAPPNGVQPIKQQIKPSPYNPNSNYFKFREIKRNTTGLLRLARNAAVKATSASNAALRAVEEAEKQQLSRSGGRRKQTKSKKRSKKYIKKRHTKHRKH
jgi:hypothetical protein